MRTAPAIVAGTVVATVVGLAFTHLGLHDVSATNPPHKTLTEPATYRSPALQPPPDLETPENVRTGARLFRDNCVLCHGAPGMEPSKASRDLRPSPPNLLRAGRRNDPAEVFLTVRSGIKGTAMPAFAGILPDEQIWSVAAFLHKSRGITASDFRQLNRSEPGKADGG
jgi:mono/diheme cytochrome c family protein